ncbi:MAG TPA: flagellar motor protein MotB [Acidobacteriaceae bacterium]|nr:flagellar motor protein MotB [Acidobacteriaceae bacterium]
MANDEQIIIIKKKGGHGGHHGGAWKVAYADFVTAMMALFIVLWLMNSSKPVQDAVGGYFRDPRGVAQKKGSALDGAGEAVSIVKKEDMAKLKENLMKAMETIPNFDKLKKQIEMTLTPEGLRIELMENPQGTFFENGKAQPTPSLQNLLKILAVDVGKLPNSISIEGHTDSKPFSDSQTYGNWELSTDRANTARRLMQDSGVRPNQVVQVRGYADQDPRKPLQPEDASNRRITLIIRYLVKPDAHPSLTSNGSLPLADELNAGAAIQPTGAAKEPKPGK